MKRSLAFALIVIAISFFLVATVSYNRVHLNVRGVVWSDAEGYYTYLPTWFILKDFHKMEPGSMWPYLNENGEFVNKYSCGVAYLQLPFFGAAYVLSKIENKDPKDFFNPVYCKAMIWSGIFFSFLGLLVLYKVLTRSFRKDISLWVVAGVFFGTNLFHYTTREMGMSHVYSFFLFAILLYHLPSFLKKPNILNSILLGAILGCITLIRPSNGIVSILIPLYDIYSWTAFKERIRFLWKNAVSLVVVAVAGFVMLIPQLMYWKEMSGKWFFYSYRHEGFQYWKNPKILAVLMDTQNGLLIYSPIVLLMLIGIIVGIRKKMFHGPVMLIIFSIATYLFASWWAWWFGGAFGHRSYVEYYALLAIPFAGLTEIIFNSKKKILKISYQVLLVVLMIYSVRLSYLYTWLGGPWDGEDWRWSWEKYEWIMHYFFKFPKE